MGCFGASFILPFFVSSSGYINCKQPLESDQSLQTELAIDMFSLNVIFFAFLTIRLATLWISIRNEKRLIQQGAVQYGKKNSLLLSVAHIAFYASAIIEANRYRTGLDATVLAGLVLLVLAFAVLFYVIAALKEIWTVKLYILPDHKINHAFLFKYTASELLSEHYSRTDWIKPVLHAKYTAIFGLPVYLIILFVRIKQEEQAMAHLRP